MSSPSEAGIDPGEAAPGDGVYASRSLPVPLERVWQVLTTTAGAEALLGSGATIGGKGEPWRSADGTHGVVRSYHPFEQIRVSWHASDDDPPGLVDLHLSRDGEGTRLEVQHARLSAGLETRDVQHRWDTALDRLAEASSA